MIGPEVFQIYLYFFFIQAEDGMRVHCVTGVQTCALLISSRRRHTRSLCDWSSDVCSSDLHSQETTSQVFGTRTRWWSLLDRPWLHTTHTFGYLATAPPGNEDRKSVV